MASVTLRIAGRDHVIACRDGEEAMLEALGARLDAHSGNAARAAGGAGGERIMLLIALMLADDLVQAEKATGAVQRAPDPALMEGIATRLEQLADSLENPLTSA